MAQVYFINLMDFMEPCTATQRILGFSNLKYKYLAAANLKVGDVFYMPEDSHAPAGLSLRVVLVVRINKDIRGGTSLTCVSLYRRAEGDKKKKKKKKKRHWKVKASKGNKKKTLYVKLRKNAFSLKSRITVNLAETCHVEGRHITVCRLGRARRKNMKKVIAKVD
jgi:hypothetical protein